jgi:hypothetical protein
MKTRLEQGSERKSRIFVSVNYFGGDLNSHAAGWGLSTGARSGTHGFYSYLMYSVVGATGTSWKNWRIGVVAGNLITAMITAMFCSGAPRTGLPANDAHSAVFIPDETAAACRSHSRLQHARTSMRVFPRLATPPRRGGA